MLQRVTRCTETIYDDSAGWCLWWRRHTTTYDDTRHCTQRRRKPTVTSRDDEWQWITTESYYCKPRSVNLLILPTYDFNLNNMQSTVISNNNSSGRSPILLLAVENC